MGLAGAVLVVGAARWTSAAGGAGLAGRGDAKVAQKTYQFRHGDWYQPGIQARACLWVALHCHGNGEVGTGQQADHGPAVPGLPADDLRRVQAGGLLGELVIFLDPPACDRDGDQPGQRAPGWVSKHRVELQRR